MIGALQSLCSYSGAGMHRIFAQESHARADAIAVNLNVKLNFDFVDRCLS